jgi:hypothetical protein
MNTKQALVLLEEAQGANIISELHHKYNTKSLNIKFKAGVNVNSAIKSLIISCL